MSFNFDANNNLLVNIQQIVAGTFSRGGTIISPTGAVSIVVWQAVFACTVTNVRGYTDVAGSTINAQHGSLSLLASDLTLSSINTWMDGGSVQNANFAAGDTLIIQVKTVSGAPTQIAIQVDFVTL